MSSSKSKTPNKTCHPKATKVIWYIDIDRQLILIISHLLVGPKLRLGSYQDIQVLAHCNGERSIEEIANTCDLPIENVQLIVEHWERHAPGILYPKPMPNRLQQRARMKKVREAVNDARKQADTFHYHQHSIEEAQNQFDTVEVTVSHFYSRPHPALQHRSYGEAFCEKVMAMGLPKGARILEIGGGVGLFSQCFLDTLAKKDPERYQSISYTIFDLAPELQRSQKEKCANHIDRMHFHLGNIEENDLDGQSFDLIISNEMIADLSVGVADRKNANNPQNEAEKLLKQYNLFEPASPQQFVVNIGAIKLIEKLPQLLSPKGIAIVTEYGNMNRYPTSVKLGEHYEFSIHFGQLMKVAEQVSAHASMTNIGDLLGFDPDYKIMSLDSHRLIGKSLFPFIGHRRLKNLPYTPQLLEDELGETAIQIGNIEYQTLKSKQAFINPFGFLAMVVTHNDKQE